MRNCARKPISPCATAFAAAGRPDAASTAPQPASGVGIAIDALSDAEAEALLLKAFADAGARVHVSDISATALEAARQQVPGLDGWCGDATSVVEFLRPLREQLEQPPAGMAEQRVAGEHQARAAAGPLARIFELERGCAAGAGAEHLRVHHLPAAHRRDAETRRLSPRLTASPR